MKLILGVTGSIGAYKAVEILRLFQKNGHQAAVVMTRSATRFIAPLTFETFIPGRVFVDMFRDGQDPLLHINLSKENDLLLVAPATANIIAKMAHGIADDLLSTLLLTFHKPVVIAPAMNSHMYENPAMVDNLAQLKRRHVGIVEPEEGSLACAEKGKGRLAALETIFQKCVDALHVQ